MNTSLHSSHRFTISTLDDGEVTGTKSYSNFDHLDGHVASRHRFAGTARWSARFVVVTIRNDSTAPIRLDHVMRSQRWWSDPAGVQTVLAPGESIDIDLGLRTLHDGWSDSPFPGVAFVVSTSDDAPLTSVS